MYYAATRGTQTGVTSEDLDLLYRSLEMMFDHDRSASRGKLTPRGLHVFTHPDAFGAAPAHRLTERIHVVRADAGDEAAPRSLADYTVIVDNKDLPTGITLTTLFS
jgi:CRISPR-associated protein Csd2